MPSQASLGFARKAKAAPRAGITDRLADLARRRKALIAEPYGCRSCGNGPCALHLLRKDIEAALHDLEAPEA